MKRKSAIALAAVFVSALFIESAPQAFAWGCTAVADDGTYGYSYNYPNKRAARQRAKAECNARTNERCEITGCDPSG